MLRHWIVSKSDPFRRGLALYHVGAVGAVGGSSPSEHLGFPLSRPPKQLLQQQQQVRLQSSSSSSSTKTMDIFSQLRWKAAEMLTSGLTVKEREQLLSKLDVPQQKDNTETTTKDEREEEELLLYQQKTIGEAVAAARMEEAQRQQHKWEAERELLLQNAQEAARARVESELLVQERRLKLERWQKELEHEATIAPTPTPTTTSSSHPTVDDSVLHPILGPVVADLGYKKIYQVSANTLATIPVWKKQRVYRHDRAKVIAADKMKTLHLGLPGILVLHEDKHGKLSIIDGQHRVGALALLAEKNPENFDLEHILVEVFSSTGDSDLSEDIFVEINKSEPIKLVDMPGVAKASDRNMITQAAGKIHEQYPDMFRASQHCRVPHLNVDNLRDALFASDVIKRHNLKSTTALVQWMQTQNELLKVKYQDADVAAKANPKALEKAKKFDFYLGMESSWFYS